MIKLSNQEFIESFQSGMIVAGLKDGKWSAFPIELFINNGIEVTLDHYVDPAEIFNIFKDKVSNPSLIQVIENLENA